MKSEKKKKIRSKVCLYCGDKIDLKKKFKEVKGITGWLLKRFSEIKSCSKCDKFFADVMEHNAKVSSKMYKKHKQQFYDNFDGQDVLPFLMPQFDQNMAQEIMNNMKPSEKGKKEKDKPAMDYVG